VSTGLGRPSPDPGFRPLVELLGCHLPRPFNLLSSGKALACEGIATEQAPPTLLQIEPAGPFGNEDLLAARMLREPGTGLQTVMTAQIVSNKNKVPVRGVGLDVLEQRERVLGIASSGPAREFPAITPSQRPIDPHRVVPTTVLQRCLDAMAIG
jgi:hypothetical protein